MIVVCFLEIHSLLLLMGDEAMMHSKSLCGCPGLLRTVTLLQISKEAFHNALENDRYVVVVPGGMAELLEVERLHDRKSPVLRLCATHKGFCKIAVQHNAAVVPVLCYGEAYQIRNALPWRWMQRNTYRLFGVLLSQYVHLLSAPSDGACPRAPLQ